MAIYTNLPIYKAAYSFMQVFSKMMPDMPRDCRYTLGQDTRRKIMEVIVLVYRANRTRQKVAVISQMRETLLEIQVYVRLMSDLKYISQGRYALLAELTSDMSKQMASWEKSERDRYGGQ